MCSSSVDHILFLEFRRKYNCILLYNTPNDRMTISAFSQNLKCTFFLPVKPLSYECIQRSSSTIANVSRQYSICLNIAYQESRSAQRGGRRFYSALSQCTEWQSLSEHSFSFIPLSPLTCDEIPSSLQGVRSLRSYEPLSLRTASPYVY